MNDHPTTTEAKPTHWSAVDPEKWTDSPEISPLEAVSVYLRDSEDEAAMLGLGDKLLRQDGFSIEVQGYIETSEPLHNDEQFDGYEPGDTYFCPVGDPVTIIVERTMRIESAG